MNSIKRKTIIFSGGGSGGHVVQAIAIIQSLSKEEFEVCYIGSYNGIEKKLVESLDLTYFGVSSGKLRRYFSLQNLTDCFRILKGIFQTFFILFKYPKKSSLVFLTGGFVTVPVAISAWIQGKKIILHEQTSRAGLANRVNSFFASKVLISFEESRSFFSHEKVLNLGYPIRDKFYDDGNVSINHDARNILFI